MVCLGKKYVKFGNAHLQTEHLLPCSATSSFREKFSGLSRSHDLVRHRSSLRGQFQHQYIRYVFSINVCTLSREKNMASSASSKKTRRQSEICVKEEFKIAVKIALDRFRFQEKQKGKSSVFKFLAHSTSRPLCMNS